MPDLRELILCSNRQKERVAGCAKDIPWTRCSCQLGDWPGSDLRSPDVTRRYYHTKRYLDDQLGQPLSADPLESIKHNDREQRSVHYCIKFTENEPGPAFGMVMCSKCLGNQHDWWPRNRIRTRPARVRSMNMRVRRYLTVLGWTIR